MTVTNLKAEKEDLTIVTDSDRRDARVLMTGCYPELILSEPEMVQAALALVSGLTPVLEEESSDGRALFTAGNGDMATSLFAATTSEGAEYHLNRAAVSLIAYLHYVKTTKADKKAEEEAVEARAVELARMFHEDPLLRFERMATLSQDKWRRLARLLEDKKADANV